jgi:general secretion pathway protein E
VVTIEDPVEYQLDNVTQIPIDENKGNTFGQLLRSVLRQDPDVILVGEIRDEETARTAMQAAMTGHVVFSTVHAKDTIAAVFRLLDLKVEPYLVANSLDLVLAQRLVRVLCEHCKRRSRAPGRGDAAGQAPAGQDRI